MGKSWVAAGGRTITDEMVERWERELETGEFFDKGVTVGGVVKTRFTTRFTTHGHQDAPGFIKIRELPQKAKKPGTPLESGITGFREVMGTCWKMSR